MTSTNGVRRWRSGVVLMVVAVLMALVGTFSTAQQSGALPITSTTAPSSFDSGVAACGIAESPQFRIVSQPSPCDVVTYVGARISIVLGSGFRWSAPTVGAGRVRVSGLVHAVSGGLSATVRALAVGQTTIRSVGGLVCPPGQACPALARLWSLNVIIVACFSTPVTVGLSASDSGRQFILRRGDRLKVVLRGPANYIWSLPTSTKLSVLQALGASRGNVARATFVAIRRGRGSINATDAANCYPECLPPSRLFTLSVVVIS